KRIEASRAQGGPKDHHGLPSMLGESSARALHPHSDDSLSGSFGDPTADGSVCSARGGVLHASPDVLLGEEFDRRFESLEVHGASPLVAVVAHGLEHPLGAVVILPELFAPA